MSEQYSTVLTSEFEGMKARIAELEAACEQLRRDDAEASQRAHRLEARWDKLVRRLNYEQAYLVRQGRHADDVRYWNLKVMRWMTELEREAKDHLPGDGKKEAE